MNMTKAELITLAEQAGFEAESDGLSGSSVDDELLYVGEYPVGEFVLKLAGLLGVEITDK